MKVCLCFKGRCFRDALYAANSSQSEVRMLCALTNQWLAEGGGASFKIQKIHTVEQASTVLDEN